MFCLVFVCEFRSVFDLLNRFYFVTQYLDTISCTKSVLFCSCTCTCTEQHLCRSASAVHAYVGTRQPPGLSLPRAPCLVRKATSPWATEDQYALFREYLDTRHADGGMADMDIFEFAAMIEETPIRSRVIEYIEPEDSTESHSGH